MLNLSDILAIAQSGWGEAKAYVGPLAAAYFGAKIAQGTAERNRTREDVRKEIRNTNAAISLAHMVANAAIQQKLQQIKPAVLAFESVKTAWDEFQRQRSSGEISRDTPFAVQIDLQTLMPPKIPSDTLRALVLDKVMVVGRPLSLVVSIDESATVLREVMTQRNAVIESFKKQGGPQADGFARRYLGVRLSPHEVDETFPNLTAQMMSSADNVIFFSMLLCEDLEKHGDALLQRHKKLLKGRQTKVSKINWGTAPAGALPPAENYASYTNAFQPLETQSLSFYRRLGRLFYGA